MAALQSAAALHAEPYEIPLHAPFVTSRGSTSTARGVRITLTLTDGHLCIGESVPVAYVTGESQETVLHTVKEAASALSGLEMEDYGHILNLISSLTLNQPSARCGLEMAALKAWSYTQRISLRRLWGGALHQMETDLTIPLVPNAPQLAADAAARGISCLKIKVGEGSHAQDLERVRAIAKAAPEAQLRIDANQAFTAHEALHFIEQLHSEQIALQLFEQPTPADDFDALTEVAQYSPVPVFADESCRTPHDALRLAVTPVHGFNLKINKTGIRDTLRNIAIAEAAGKKLMLGCMLETSRSIAVSLSLACGTGAFHYLDLDSHLLLNDAAANTWFEQHNNMLTLSEAQL